MNLNDLDTVINELEKHLEFLDETASLLDSKEDFLTKWVGDELLTACNPLERQIQALKRMADEMQDEYVHFKDVEAYMVDNPPEREF